MQDHAEHRRTLWIGAVGVGVLAAAVLCFPTFAPVHDGIVGYYNDDWANGIYLHHQVHEALMSGRLDLSDPEQFFPFGYNPVHSNGGNILEMLVSGLFRLVAPWPLWLSLAALAWIPLNALAFIPLGRRLWKERSTVLAAAATWALFPPTLHQITAGRLTQAALIGVPLVVAGLLDLSERSDRKGIALTAGGWALAGLGYWFNALFIGLLAPAFLVYAQRSRRMSLMVDLVVSGVLALLLVSPMLLVVFWPALTGGQAGGTHISPDAMPLAFPDALQLMSGQKPGLADWMPWSCLGGILASVLLRDRRWWLWLGLGVLCVVFALGPGQRIAGEIWRMPYWVPWRLVPGLARMFHPDRWMLVGGLFIAVLAVGGVASIHRWLVWVVPLGVVAQLALRGRIPLDSWSPSLPDHWAELAALPGSEAVIVLPLHGSQLSGQYQWLHGRPLWGGMVEDQPWNHPKAWVEYERKSPFLSGLRALSYGREVTLKLEAEEALGLNADGFGWLVLDHSAWSAKGLGATSQAEAEISRVLGGPVHRSSSGLVWRLATE